MLYKLLSHVDLSGEIMPRKLMELAPGTQFNDFIHLCAFLSKNTCLQNEPQQAQDRKIKLSHVSQTLSLYTTCIFEAVLVGPCLKYSRILTYKHVCLQKAFPSWCSYLCFADDPILKFRTICGLLQKTCFAFFLCLRIGLLSVI